MVRYTYYDYKTKRCSGIDYVKSQYIGEGEGEVIAYNLYGNRYIYAIKRKTEKLTSDGPIPCVEYKLYDLDNPNNSCLDKRRNFGSKPMTIKQYLKKVLLNDEIKNYISARRCFFD